MLSSDVRNVPFGRATALTTARRAMVTAAVLARHAARGAARARRVFDATVPIAEERAG